MTGILRRLAGVLVLLLILPLFMILAAAEIGAGMVRWFITGKDGMDERVLRPSLLNWVADLPARIGGWEE